MDVVTLLLGLAALLFGADLLVKGAESTAIRAGVSPLVIGLTVVSFGTSLPELVVTLVSGIQHKPDLAVANVIGSNIANVLLVLGIAAMIRPLPVRDATVVSEIPFSLSAALLVGFLANAALFAPYPELTISRLDGFILLFFFLLFMMYVYKVSSGDGTDAGPSPRELTLPRTGTYLILGLIALYFGGGWVVGGATGLAAAWGVDDALIGLTVIAVGTSSPEIFTSAVAAYRNQADLAIGNAVGSNIFNLLLVLGSTAAIAELPFEVLSNTDLAMVIAASALLILALAASRTNTVRRSHGAVFVVLYGLYVWYAIVRV
jgi:cation:H+ antiporter